MILFLNIFLICNFLTTLCYLVKSDFSIVYVYCSVYWTSHFLQGPRKTQPCLSGLIVPALLIQEGSYDICCIVQAEHLLYKGSVQFN